MNLYIIIGSIALACVILMISMIKLEGKVQNLEGWMDTIQAHLKLTDALLEHIDRRLDEIREVLK